MGLRDEGSGFRVSISCIGFEANGTRASEFEGGDGCRRSLSARGDYVKYANSAPWTLDPEPPPEAHRAICSSGDCTLYLDSRHGLYGKTLANMQASTYIPDPKPC